MVELLNDQRKRTGEILTDWEAALYIACLERRVQDLVGELDRRGLGQEVDGFRRADKNCLCSCGKTYGEHPYGGPILYDRSMILHRLCDGSLVKL